MAQWFKCCATNRKVAGSIPASVTGIFHCHKFLPIALWPWARHSLQQKWVPGAFPGGKGGPCLRLTTLPPSCAVIMKFGNLNFLEPSGPLRACNGTALPLPFWIMDSQNFSPWYYYYYYYYYSYYVVYCYHLYASYFYNFMPEPNRVSRVHRVAALLRWQFGETVQPFPMTDLSYFHISTFRSKCALWLFSVVHYCVSQVCCSGIVGVILKWFELKLFYWCHFCFDIPHAMYFYCKVFIF